MKDREAQSLGWEDALEKEMATHSNIPACEVPWTSGLPWWLRRQRICLQWGRAGFYPCVGKILWRRAWQLTPVFAERTPMDRNAWWATYSPWSHEELDTTEWLNSSSVRGPLMEAGTQTRETDKKEKCRTVSWGNQGAIKQTGFIPRGKSVCVYIYISRNASWQK